MAIYRTWSSKTPASTCVDDGGASAWVRHSAGERPALSQWTTRGSPAFHGKHAASPSARVPRPAVVTARVTASSNSERARQRARRQETAPHLQAFLGARRHSGLPSGHRAHQRCAPLWVSLALESRIGPFVQRRQGFVTARRARNPEPHKRCAICSDYAPRETRTPTPDIRRDKALNLARLPIPPQAPEGCANYSPGRPTVAWLHAVRSPGPMYLVEHMFVSALLGGDQWI